ncbi:hypothetical protein [Brevibacillus reuszeri]|uniref:hypothetical protein n=1 Tax=Brevibacillus reuszeri TaxID=54915 RepID=UPI0013E06DBE|nr:hypothetical protein [Brevibacillus reuszeri]
MSRGIALNEKTSVVFYQEKDLICVIQKDGELNHTVWLTKEELKELLEEINK